MGKPSFRFEQGDAIVIDGALYDLISRTDDGLEVRHLGASRVLRNLSHDEFWHLYHERNDDGARRLVVHRGLRGAVPAPVAANLSLPLEDFDPRWQDEALKRLDYVQTCSRLFSPDKPNRRGRFPMRPEGYARAARLVAGIRRRRDAKAAGKPCRAIALDVVSGSTLRDWYWRWNRSGQSLLALLPCHDAKGQIGTRLDPAVIEVMGRWLRELYLTVERPDAKPVYDCVAGEIEEKNKGLIQPLKIPSYETFLRCIKEWISPYDLVLKREGAAAGQKFRQLRRPLERPFRPFQIVEIDHIFCAPTTSTAPGGAIGGSGTGG
jgi:putative transposase